MNGRICTAVCYFCYTPKMQYQMKEKNTDTYDSEICYFPRKKILQTLVQFATFARFYTAKFNTLKVYLQYFK